MSATGLFVTGTDTGVGKTFVVAGMARALRKRGVRVAVLKPVETGCGDASDNHPLDGELLARAVGYEGDLNEIVPCRYVEALAPSVAARREKRPIDFDAIDRALRKARQASDVVLVEGCGGLMVPLTHTMTVGELALRIGFPLIIVARPTLGTLNHCGLTIHYARSLGLSVLGIILNGWKSESSDVAQDTNPIEIEQLYSIRILGRIPWLSRPLAHEEVVDCIENAIDINSLVSTATSCTRTRRNSPALTPNS